MRRADMPKCRFDVRSATLARFSQAEQSDGQHGDALLDVATVFLQMAVGHRLDGSMVVGVKGPESDEVIGHDRPLLCVHAAKAATSR